MFEVTGSNPLLEIALELERITCQDDYFISRRLYPNVDFYSATIYRVSCPGFDGGSETRIRSSGEEFLRYATTEEVSR